MPKYVVCLRTQLLIIPYRMPRSTMKYPGLVVYMW